MMPYLTESLEKFFLRTELQHALADFDESAKKVYYDHTVSPLINLI